MSVEFVCLIKGKEGGDEEVQAFELRLLLSKDPPRGELKADDPWYNNENLTLEVLDF
ncbi:MAG: hypothetical protein U0840_21685 [Gemmataceae bacterium]